jgi:uncharacterized membrane protein
MHGGGAKRVRFKKKFQMRVKFKICFKFGLKIKKIDIYAWMSGVGGLSCASSVELVQLTPTPSRCGDFSFSVK